MTDPGDQRGAILIVDDSAFFRSTISLALAAMEGLGVLEAKNGREALELLSGPTKIEAIILDVSTPILPGAEMLERLGQTIDHPPFIIAVGTADESALLARCLELGADVTLTKPLDVDALRLLLSAELFPEIRDEATLP